MKPEGTYLGEPGSMTVDLVLPRDLIQSGGLNPAGVAIIEFVDAASNDK